MLPSKIVHDGSRREPSRGETSRLLSGGVTSCGVGRPVVITSPFSLYSDGGVQAGHGTTAPLCYTAAPQGNYGELIWDCEAEWEKARTR
jgi:hypothetical protein